MLPAGPKGYPSFFQNMGKSKNEEIMARCILRAINNRMLRSGIIDEDTKKRIENRIQRLKIVSN